VQKLSRKKAQKAQKQIQIIFVPFCGYCEVIRTVSQKYAAAST